MIAAVYDVLLELPGWTMAGATVWPRAAFRCEYCGTLLVGDIGTHKWGQQYDHILPRSKYPNILTEPATASWLRQTGTSYRNIALACCFCNRAKNDFDAGAGIVCVEVTDISDKQRSALVDCLRQEFGMRGREQWAAAFAEFLKFHQATARLVVDDHGTAPTTHRCTRAGIQ
jgi:hypothetical protein